MISIYYTLCYPHLVYCLSIWASTWPSFICKLEIAQNKILRCIFHLGKFDSTGNILCEYKLLTFYNIHKCFLLLTMFKNVTFRQGIPVFRVSEIIHSTRINNANIICPRYRTTLFKNSLFYLGPQLWNSLPEHIKILYYSASLPQFKRKIKDYLFTIQNQ